MLKTLDMSSGAWEMEERVEVGTDAAQSPTRAATLQLGLRLQEVSFTEDLSRSRRLTPEETALALLH